MSKPIVSGTLLAVLLMSVLTLTFYVPSVKASRTTIYIRADGRVSPSSANITTTDSVTYTFTGNNYASIVVQRNNIAIDGNGHTLQGGWTGRGIDLSSRSNVTIKNTRITAFTYGIWLESSSNNSLSDNDIVENLEGILLYSSSSNSLNGNDIADNEEGIWLYSSSNNDLNDNDVANNDIGVRLYSSSNNSLNGNDITASNGQGISLESSSGNSLNSNNIAHNGYGIWLESSSNNSLGGNNIASCGYGVLLYSSVNNKFYHNNFIGNNDQVYLAESMNVWNDSYPSGGNYWSDYAGVDSNHGSNQNIAGGDGIGDTAYTIDANNVDHYPLTGPFKTFDAGTWNNTSFDVNIVSKSNITNFNFDPYATPYPTLSFDVEGESGTTGVCRVTIPKEMMWCDSSDQWTITVGGTLTTAETIIEDGNYTYIYFTYTYSTKTVQIQSTHAVPELQSFLLLPLFMIVTLLVGFIFKRTNLTKKRTKPS